jgi:SET domain-containing protein
LPSTIPQAGKGLFVLDKKQPIGTVLIKKAQTVCPYGGELIDKDTLEKRYGNKTAPYAVQLSKTSFRDGGCARGVGSLLNHDSRRANVTFSVNQNSKTVSIKATRNLKNGEELFINYGREYTMRDGSKYVTVLR